MADTPSSNGNKPGRPTKLTPEVHQSVYQMLRDGCTFEAACRAVDIDPELARQWVQRGEGRHPTLPALEPYVGFAGAVKKARGEDQARRVTRINQAAEGGRVVFRRTVTKTNGDVVVEEKFSEPDWTADAWHLERSDWKHWGKKQQLVLKQEDDGDKKLSRLPSDIVNRVNDLRLGTAAGVGAVESGGAGGVREPGPVVDSPPPAPHQ